MMIRWWKRITWYPELDIASNWKDPRYVIALGPMGTGCKNGQSWIDWKNLRRYQKVNEGSGKEWKFIPGSC